MILSNYTMSYCGSLPIYHSLSLLSFLNMSMSFVKFGKVLSIISSNHPSALLSLSSPSAVIYGLVLLTHSSDGKESACNAGDWVQFPSREDPLEKEMATHSSILAWRISWTEEPGGLQSMGWQSVGHD